MILKTCTDTPYQTRKSLQLMKYINNIYSYIGYSKFLKVFLFLVLEVENIF